LKNVIISFFTNIGMLDIPFKELGYCVVSAGDTLLGQHFDIRNFKPVRGMCEGIIGGPPCQWISRANRKRNVSKGMELINEFIRVVIESDCEWFLMENVDSVPDIEIEGYKIQSFILNAKNCGLSQNRNRKFQFGSKKGLMLEINREQSPLILQSCVTASRQGLTKRNMCELQGLPKDFDLPDFTINGFNRAVGNGVPLNMGRKVAKAIRKATERKTARTLTNVKFCVCGCGEEIIQKKGVKETIHFNATCRQRMKTRRDESRVNCA
jgi:DNA (cytosine-5)-methyltransferase 1